MERPQTQLTPVRAFPVHAASGSVSFPAGSARLSFERAASGEHKPAAPPPLCVERQSHGLLHGELGRGGHQAVVGVRHVSPELVELQTDDANTASASRSLLDPPPARGRGDTVMTFTLNRRKLLHQLSSRRVVAFQLFVTHAPVHALQRLRPGFGQLGDEEEEGVKEATARPTETCTVGRTVVVASPSLFP
ncbi:hypothetical protein EYF80_039442 [Liparis tanakae]|uniref:Uncharacterized protein n=1 Tax=Liparis tanakae TaxID=230148 RepID=A0A4Z2GAZ7_9TELE|nr:hypothetical protein EYF80_039442 [Liparis tanakae]